MNDTTISRAFVSFTTHHNNEATYETIQVMATPNDSDHICINYNRLVATVINELFCDVNVDKLAEQIGNDSHAGYRIFEDLQDKRTLSFKIQTDEYTTITIGRDDTHRESDAPANIYIGWEDADDKNTNIWIEVEEVSVDEVIRIQKLAGTMLKYC